MRRYRVYRFNVSPWRRRESERVTRADVSASEQYERRTPGVESETCKSRAALESGPAHGAAFPVMDVIFSTSGKTVSKGPFTLATWDSRLSD